MYEYMRTRTRSVWLLSTCRPASWSNSNQNRATYRGSVPSEADPSSDFTLKILWGVDELPVRFQGWKKRGLGVSCFFPLLSCLVLCFWQLLHLFMFKASTGKSYLKRCRTHLALVILFLSLVSLFLRVVMTSYCLQFLGN